MLESPGRSFLSKKGMFLSSADFWVRTPPAENGPAGIRNGTDYSILDGLSANRVRRVVDRDVFDV